MSSPPAAAASSSLVASPDGLSSISSEAAPIPPRPAAGEGEGEDDVDVDESEPSGNDGVAKEVVEEDLICRRTRARYSLANFTLDELEAFLQETDDEDDFHKPDDEEVYRKFLAGVLAGDAEPRHADGEAEDDDEEDENDADFEVELEELLDSDHDGDGKEEKGIAPGVTKRVGVRDRLRPNTRQNRRRQILARPNSAPVRSILPSLIPCDQRKQLLGFEPHINVGRSSFTHHQIGQLHCLIHEHVQLLIQIYALCSFDPSKLPIAADVKKLILELCAFRNDALSRRTLPYTSSSFQPPHIHASASVLYEAPNNGEQLPATWAPVVGSSIMSVSDVAPLGLVEGYLADASNAARNYMLRFLAVAAERGHFDLVPLFPFSRARAIDGAGKTSVRPNLGSQSEQPSPPKKSMASALVECTMKQSVALAPRAIVKLSQQFFHMFNPALFPHVPPSVTLASRALFTDAEDELLAMGMREYNNDWKSIHERFLPCKTMHQIFVRAKNRCSSKAPDNPIKAVRQMKASPLTEEEKALIYEGLKTCKLDWTQLWKFYLPHRDPTLLPRQWRDAVGIKKSYKKDELARERRRLYERERRKFKKSFPPNGLAREVDAAGYNNDTDQHVGEDDASHVHEAFLANDTSQYSTHASLEDPVSIAAAKTSDFSHVKHNASLNSVSILQWSDQRFSGLTKRFQPYYMPKRKGKTLVKLAPNLPPVSLPAFVRVITRPPLSTTAVGEREASSRSAPSQKHCFQVPTIPTDQKNLEETGHDTGLKMHPLLLDASEHGPSQYCSSNYRSTSNTLNFFPSCSLQPVQAGSRGAREATNGLLSSAAGEHTYTTDTPERHPSSLSALDFHPLLHSVEISTNTNTMPTLSLASSSLLSDKNSNHSQTEDTLQANEISLATPFGKENEFDLNVRLPSSSLVDETVQSRNENEPNKSRMELVDLNLNQFYSEDCTVNTLSTVAFTDQIVMEREELSDSDEEVKNVDFEREEMADSEAEELNFEDVRYERVEEAHATNESKDINLSGKVSERVEDICIGAEKSPLPGRKNAPRRATKRTKVCLNSSNPELKAERKRRRESKDDKAVEKHQPNNVLERPRRSRKNPNEETETPEVTLTLKPGHHVNSSTSTNKKPITRSMRTLRT